MLSPLQIWGDIIYVLICFMTDPERRANCRSLPCEPLLLDDGRGIEGLHVGQLKERELGHLRSGSLQGVLASKVTCLEARSLLAKTQVYSSLKDAGSFPPYTSGVLQPGKFIFLINIPQLKMRLYSIQGWQKFGTQFIYCRGQFWCFWPSQDLTWW